MLSGHSPHRFEPARPSPRKRSEAFARRGERFLLGVESLTRWPSLQDRAGREQGRAIARQSCLPRLDLRLQDAEQSRVRIAFPRVISNRLTRAGYVWTDLLV